MTDVNAPLAVGDPVVATAQTANGPLPGPFAGQSINCRSCHFVVEFQGVQGAGNRTYADFADHSPIPRVLTGFTATPRNSMHMVGSMQSHEGPSFLHFDGEFADPADLAPYFHNGSAAKFTDVAEFYIKASTLAHQGALRNAPAEFQGMSLSESDVAALAAFLASLTEDYDDA